MKSVNILYLANSGDIIGGGEISLLGLLSRLDKERFVPLVICPSRGDLSEAIAKLGIEVKIVRIESLKKLNFFGFMDSIKELKRIIKSRAVALVHANGSRCALYGGIACRKVKVPMLWHVRIMESDGLLDRFLARLSTVIIVNSNAVQRRFKWLKEEDKIRVIYNGIDLDEFGSGIQGNKIRDEFGIGQAAALVTTVGRLDWYKAHQYFLQAAGRVKEAVPGAIFLIVGDGERRNYLERLAKESELGKQVIFAGYRKDIPAILAATDLFVLSSVSEGFGRSAVEAMACAKPVVATRVGGLEEVVLDGVTGILVPAKNPAALAEALIGLLKDTQKAKKMGAAGRKRAEEIFGIEKNVETTEALYEKVLLAEA